VHDPFAHGESEAGSLSCSLGGEEGFGNVSIAKRSVSGEIVHDEIHQHQNSDIRGRLGDLQLTK
jgi:hypothetical protein